jgi:hypothetical protein
MCQFNIMEGRSIEHNSSNLRINNSNLRINSSSSSNVAAARYVVAAVVVPVSAAKLTVIAIPENAVTEVIAVKATISEVTAVSWKGIAQQKMMVYFPILLLLLLSHSTH